MTKQAHNDTKLPGNPAGSSWAEEPSAKVASIQLLSPFVDGFADELTKIGGITNAPKRLTQLLSGGRNTSTQKPGLVNRLLKRKEVVNRPGNSLSSLGHHDDDVAHEAWKSVGTRAALGVGAAVGAKSLLGRRDDQMQKQANLGADGGATTMSEVKSTIPRSTMKSATKYSKVHSDMSESPAQKHQPVLSPPPVRG